MRRLLWNMAVMGMLTGRCAAAWGNEACYLSPAALVASPDAKTLFVACATASRVLLFDLDSKAVVGSIDVPASPSGLALSADGGTLYITCASPSSTVCVFDVMDRRIVASIKVGHTAMCPILSPEGNTLYVCNRFNNDLSVIDLGANVEVTRIPVSREPVSAAITLDGKYLLVANHRHNSITDGGAIGAVVSVVDTALARVVKRIQLGRGAGMVNGIAVSPDGRFAAVVHLLARYYLPTTDVQFGTMNANVMTLLDLNRLQIVRFGYFDFSGQGAANPWAVSWTPDGKTILATHAGTHEVSLVESPERPQKSFRILRRVALAGLGPRALAIVGSQVYIANYFSDNLSQLDLSAPEPVDAPLELAPPAELTKVRQGEILFNDARLCHQGWQSCASCHDSDARADGLQWDLLNDGLRNPKNAKSLVWAHQTPPAMALGVRKNAEVAVRAGIKFILFTRQPEAVAECMDEYLKSLQPAPSPYLANGRLSRAAERGRQLFISRDVGCARCHPAPLFTDLKSHNVGSSGSYDAPAEVAFDTPTLVELWRTAPYLHDGTAATIEAVLTAHNRQDQHGRTSHLTKEQMNDLVEYLLSL